LTPRKELIGAGVAGREAKRGDRSVGIVVGAVSAVALVVGVVAGHWQAPPGAAGPTTLTVSRSGCGEGWSRPHTGVQTLSAHNTGDLAAEADLIDPTSGAIFAVWEALGPGTTRALRVDLGAGTYALRCLPEETDALVGPVVRLPGSAHGQPGIVPVTANDLIEPVRVYRASVAAGLGTLVTATTALKQAVDSGDRARAEAAWLPAHLAYERLGAAYDTFGDFDGEIDGTTAGLPGGVADPDFTGFHRVEYGLWHGAPMTALAAPAAALAKAVTELAADFPREQTDARDLGLRAHEILEGTLQFELTGESDEGSGSNLATAAANLAGTRMVLAALRPVLATRYPDPPALDAALATFAQALTATQRPGGGYPPVGELTPDQHQHLDAALGDLLERLAPVAVICDVRRT
jgi:iron uptake system component EfeO